MFVTSFQTNPIGSFDHFSFANDLADGYVSDVDTDSEVLDNEDEDPVPEPAKPPPKKKKGPAIKKSILCDDEFVPMPKTAAGVGSADKQKSDALEEAPAAEIKEKKNQSRKKIAASKGGKAKSAKKRTAAKQSLEKVERAEAAPREDPLDSPDPPKAPPKKPKIPKKAKSKISKKTSKKAKQRELTEDVKAQLKELMSKIYFAF